MKAWSSAFLGKYFLAIVQIKPWVNAKVHEYTIPQCFFDRILNPLGQFCKEGGSHCSK